MINQNLKKELLKNIEITKQATQNSIELTIESYIEMQSRLDLITYLLISDDKKLS